MRAFFSFTLSLSFFIIITSAQAGELRQGQYMSEIKVPQKTVFGLTIWNIYKNQDEDFQLEFKSLAQNSSLMLLQEVHLTPTIVNFWERQLKFPWMFATAWEKPTGPTGTGLISNYNVEKAQSILSADTEPFANTPKSSVVAYLPIEGSSETLLVVNTHAINFTFLGPFERQLIALYEIINTHTGPVIWAGDFNTWNGGRWDLLMNVTIQLGLFPVDFYQDPRLMVLDHVFVRGLKIHSSLVSTEHITSDHWPLIVDVEVL